jgi:1-acyl-sn-glycerol-3-phosphate acyltransferase
MPPGPDKRAEQLLTVLGDFAKDSRISLPARGLSLDTRFEADLGLDSLARSELLSRVEKALDASLPQEALLAQTPRDLFELLCVAQPDMDALEGPAETPIADEIVGSPASARSLLEVLQWHLDRHPQRPHILLYGDSDRATPIGYADLRHGAARVAALLQREGLAMGERVALMLPTGTDYFFGFLGVLMAGGIPVPIYPPARPEQIEDHLRRHARILDNAGCAFLITIPRARLIARLLSAQVASLRDVLTLEGLDTVVPASDFPNLAGGDTAFLQYTSGSTGDPKGVVLTHADLLANIRAMGEAARVRSDDVFVSWLPLYHDMGLIGAWLGSLYFGLTLVSLSPLAFLARPRRWIEAIHRHRGTLSAAPNFAYELCLKRIGEGDLEGLDLSSWRWAFNGAEPVSPDTLRRFADRFAPVGFRRESLAPVYGLAEAAVGLAFPPPDRGPRIDCIDRAHFSRYGYALPLPCQQPGVLEVVACGRPLPGYRVRVVDENGAELPDRHEGLLRFQGPSATKGYFRRPEATAALIRDGWHDTGDRAYLAGGDIYLTGRVKDLIIRGGRNVYPYELEEAVGEIEGIRKGCVVAFAAEDPATGSERLVVVAETREKDSDRLASLERAARERAGDIIGMPPDDVVLAPPRAIPKTSSGKLRRGSARDLYLEGRLGVGPGNPFWQLIRVATGGIRALVFRVLSHLPEYLYAAWAWGLLVLVAPWVWMGVMLAPKLGWRWSLVRGGLRLVRGLSGIRIRVQGLEHLPAPGSSFVLAANHQSYLDAMALIDAIPRPLVFVAKSELTEAAWIRVFLKRLGTVFVERFDLQSGAADAERFSRVLTRDGILAFFPEGTFRTEPGLLGFRMGAFVAAAQHDLPILPVAIVGTRKIMTGTRFVPRPGYCRVVIGDPVNPAGRDWKDAVSLRDTTRQFVLSVTGEEDLNLVR